MYLNNDKISGNYVHSMEYWLTISKYSVINYGETIGEAFVD